MGLRHTGYATLVLSSRTRGSSSSEHSAFPTAPGKKRSQACPASLFAVFSNLGGCVACALADRSFPGVDARLRDFCSPLPPAPQMQPRRQKTVVATESPHGIVWPPSVPGPPGLSLQRPLGLHPWGSKPSFSQRSFCDQRPATFPRSPKFLMPHLPETEAWEHAPATLPGPPPGVPITHSLEHAPSLTVLLRGVAAAGQSR